LSGLQCGRAMAAPGTRQNLLQSRGRMSLPGYNCVLVPGSHDSGVDVELPLPLLDATGTSSSSGSSTVHAQVVGHHGSRQSRNRHERRGQARMSLAGYNETAYYGGVSVLADSDGCSSTRDSSNMSVATVDEASPWAVWRRWASEGEEQWESERALSDVDSGGEGSSSCAASMASDSDKARSRRRSARRSARASLAGYNCAGAVSVTGEDGAVIGRGAGNQAADAGERLSTIGEVLEMGLDWWGDASSQSARAEGTARHESRSPAHYRLNSADDQAVQVTTAAELAIVQHYDLLDEARQSSPSGWSASMPWADDGEDETLDMGLQDDPIAEAGFLFAVEYGQACVQANHVYRRGRVAAAVS